MRKIDGLGEREKDRLTPPSPLCWCERSECDLEAKPTKNCYRRRSAGGKARSGSQQSVEELKIPWKCIGFQEINSESKSGKKLDGESKGFRKNCVLLIPTEKDCLKLRVNLL